MCLPMTSVFHPLPHPAQCQRHTFRVRHAVRSSSAMACAAAGPTRKAGVVRNEPGWSMIIATRAPRVAHRRRIICACYAVRTTVGRQSSNTVVSTSSKPSFENVSAEQCRGPKRRQPVTRYMALRKTWAGDILNPMLGRENAQQRPLNGRTTGKSAMQSNHHQRPSKDAADRAASRASAGD
jgi:hypothetical protein